MSSYKDFSILLFSPDLAAESLCKGYCYFKNCDVITTIHLSELKIELLKGFRSKLIILDLSHVLNSIEKKEWESIRKILVGNPVTFCGLSKVQLFDDLITAQNLCIDKFFTLPLDIDQLNKYISKINLDREKIKDEKRTRTRRYGIDRREFLDRRHVGSLALTHKNELQNVTENKGNVQKFEVTLDKKYKCLKINKKEIVLTRREFDFISYLAGKPDEISLSEDIIQFLWPNKEYAAKGELHQYVYLLRKKIEQNPCSPSIVLTVKGHGYRLGCVISVTE